MITCRSALAYGAVIFLVGWALWSCVPIPDGTPTPLQMSGALAIAAAFGFAAGKRNAKGGTG